MTTTQTTASSPRSASPSEALAAAVTMLLARRAGIDAPHREVDRAGRWSPTSEERAACCRYVRSTLTWEAAARRHCVSARHVAAMHGVPEHALVSAVRANASTSVDGARP